KKDGEKMGSLFPYANVVAGALIVVVGVCFHWLGQLVSVVNWGLATRLGLQEKALPPEYKVYEHALAVADVALGWIYGVAAVGLFLDAGWGYKLAWIPGSILLYHAVGAWVWEANRRAAGHRLMSDSLRIGWCFANAVAGVFVLAVAWAGKTG
ncbi:MAG TPA: hypothetical protein PLI51_08065, partial [bacterium]|nr:hypothetical protein [bacterium]HPQ66664.1 hypothetical protein [bacterium]